MITQTTYIVEIYGDDAMAFSSLLIDNNLTKVTRHNKKQLSLKKEIIDIEGHCYIKRSIKRINQKQYNGDVCNLRVSNTSTFLVSGLGVHNCGAGGGGFLLFYVEPDYQDRVKEAMRSLLHVPFKFEYGGSKIIVRNNG